MTARLARLLDEIVAESAEYAEHAGHVRAGVYRAHARALALLAGGAAAKGRTKPRISARRSAAMADLDARKFGPKIPRPLRAYIKSVKDSNKRRPTRRRKG